MAAGCTPPPPPPAPAPPPPPLPAAVWTAAADLVVQSGTRPVLLPHPFTRLEVVAPGQSAGSLRVRCEVCTETLAGEVARSGVIHRPASPAVAAGGSLAGFVLAVREAASRRDIDGLGRVMSKEFVYSLSGGEGVETALAAWERERYRRLDRLPFLLDRGVARVDGSELWAAPPEFVEGLGYTGLRAGFRREGGRWVWLFLVGG